MTLKKKIRTRNGRYTIFFVSTIYYNIGAYYDIVFLSVDEKGKKNLWRRKEKIKIFSRFLCKIRQLLMCTWKCFCLSRLRILKDVVCSCIAAETDFLQLEVYEVARCNQNLNKFRLDELFWLPLTVNSLTPLKLLDHIDFSPFLKFVQLCSSFKIVYESCIERKL